MLRDGAAGTNKQTNNTHSIKQGLVFRFSTFVTTLPLNSCQYLTGVGRQKFTQGR
jgi:hypothetical protein